MNFFAGRNLIKDTPFRLACLRIEPENNFEEGWNQKKGEIYVGHGLVTHIPNLTVSGDVGSGSRGEVYGPTYHSSHGNGTTIMGPETFHLICLDSIQTCSVPVLENPSNESKTRILGAGTETDWWYKTQSIKIILCSLFSNQGLCQK